MTIEGWVQIALFSVIIILITRPLGGYMTRVFNGERTFLSPVLRPVERAVYWCCGVNEKEEQHWLTYAVALLFFSVAGFASLYACSVCNGICRSTLRARPASRRTSPSTPRSASSPTR